MRIGNPERGAGPSRFNDSTAPGLSVQPAFVQFGEALRVRPWFLNDRIQLGYTLQYQQFVSPKSEFSFNRWTVNLNHEFPIYHTSVPALRRETNGPNECFASPSDHRRPGVTRDRWGAASFRLLVSKSRVGDAGAVPFYLQRTLGGSDVNGNRLVRAGWRRARGYHPSTAACFRHGRSPCSGRRLKGTLSERL